LGSYFILVTLRGREEKKLHKEERGGGKKKGEL